MILPDDEATRIRAAQSISAGGCLAFRTDTFYGLGVDPFNRAALRRLKSLKNREEGKPILILISDAAQAVRFMAGRSNLFETVCETYWPGALTLVVQARPELAEELTAGTATIGVRLPDDEDVRSLVRACGGALTATSANPSGEPPAQTASEVAGYFPGGLSLIVDGGAARSTQPSTVLDVSGDSARLIREGVITREELQKFLTKD